MFKSRPGDELLDVVNPLRHLGLDSLVVSIYNHIQVKLHVINTLLGDLKHRSLPVCSGRPYHSEASCLACT